MTRGKAQDYDRVRALLVTGATRFPGKALIEGRFDRLPDIRQVDWFGKVN